MSDDAIRVFAGDCTVTVSGTDRNSQRGRLLSLVKPDGTVLVHDADGYQPVAWLTRAGAVHCTRETGDDGGFTIEAVTDDRRLRVESHRDDGGASYPTAAAGIPVGPCDCGGTFVRAGGQVHCLGCEAVHGIPRDAAVLEDRCDCGLPLMAVERGAAFRICVDRDCEPLDAMVRERFDREWNCPNCDGDLRVLRRGGLLAGCEHHPDCDTGFAIPTGTVVGTCDCNLPRFETSDGTRCLDATCDA